MPNVQAIAKKMSVDYVWPDTNVNITFLPLSNPLCANTACLAFAKAKKESRVINSYDDQFYYGYYVSIFYANFLAARALILISRRRILDVEPPQSRHLSFYYTI
ncbi:hypothetical protein M409DRAFT_27148 [Zasmidium cellare ATCC 36951]|uniref:Uncharacterized protein n=1 Tax=Zasmidium cellare ATCC 36951 TaxID=1080233 RepID=A0A6A6C676_ZASCE|nr:uncharacterized protein M409DRAFT_27148 [Zasmidium cellare ATCC 36951]KAF2162525.1 hypothetical protein M409DRAFT_27148 [Zasmidium cellare ATCC 36951]